MGGCVNAGSDVEMTINFWPWPHKDQVEINPLLGDSQHLLNVKLLLLCRV